MCHYHDTRRHDGVATMRVQFHTLAVPRDERVEYWRRAKLAALGLDVHVEPQRGVNFEARLGVLGCGELDLVPIDGTPMQVTRPGFGRPGWVSLLFQLAGHASVRDGRQEVRLDAGDACLLPPRQAVAVSRHTLFRQILLSIPEPLLDVALPCWPQRVQQRLDATLPGVKAAASLLGFVLAHHERLGPEVREQLGGAALGLLSGLCDRPAPARTTAPRTVSARSRQRERAERLILERLHDSQLTVGSIAQELGISKRYLHTLFQGDHNVMQWVLEQRLQGCRRELAQRGTRAIADVAYGWGFSSPSHFSRCFSKRFGLRASEV